MTKVRTQHFIHNRLARWPRVPAFGLIVDSAVPEHLETPSFMLAAVHRADDCAHLL